MLEKEKAISLAETLTLMEFERKIGRSIYTSNIDTAIGRVQGTLTIQKNKQAHQYKYADLPSILAACYETFSVEGLVLKQPMWEDDQGRMELHTIVSHPESGEWISSKMAFPALKGTEKNDCQAIGSIQSYWRRYSLLSLIGVDDEDDDGKKADGYKMTTHKEPYSPYISEKQLALLDRLINQYPDIAKQIANKYNVTKKGDILRKDFNDILSMFPSDQNSN